MPYNKDNFKNVREKFETKHRIALELASLRHGEVISSIHEIGVIDKKLSETGLRIIEASHKGTYGLESRIALLKAENAELLSMREVLLAENGYPIDYLEPKFECLDCSDTGYVGLYMCKCMKAALSEAGFKSSGIGRLIEDQNFETFSLDYYLPIMEFHKKMCDNYSSLYEYAYNFTSKVFQKNWLLIGTTGLGKTHMSTSVARVVIERGNDVVYETTQNIMGDFESERFKNISTGYSTNRYFSCDLLIMDDLGTELLTTFTISCLYNIINTRINAKKPIIINTNLGTDELRKRYADRITSRIFGEFHALEFLGKDVRLQKLSKK